MNPNIRNQEDYNMTNLIHDYHQAYTSTLVPQMTSLTEVKYWADFAGKVPIRILDVGCAEGTLVKELSKRGHDVTGTDIVPMNGSIYLDIEQTALAEKFDLIYFLDVLEHLRNPTAALDNLRKMISDNGLIIIYTPNSNYWKRVIYNWTCKHWKGYHSSLHLSIWDFDQLHQTLAFCGLTCDPIIRWPFYAMAQELLVKCRKREPLSVEEVLGVKENEHNLHTIQR
jgi:SAM-dependent methyltransferase